MDKSLKIKNKTEKRIRVFYKEFQKLSKKKPFMRFLSKFSGYSINYIIDLIYNQKSFTSTQIIIFINGLRLYNLENVKRINQEISKLKEKKKIYKKTDKIFNKIIVV